MPNIKSAIKRVAVTQKKTEANKIQKSAIRTTAKKARVAIETSSPDAKAIVDEAIVKFDKAVSKGFMHKNTAARRKSRMTKAINAAK
jgi:small subunit ribosomal protein S20